MSSRLDRLFVLLENGGSGITRKAAAYQLGEVVSSHPQELDNLLQRLHAFIISKSWDTRVAAAKAVEAIIRGLPKWEPIPINNEGDEFSSNDINEKGQLSLKSFSIRKVLERGSYLLGADENHFDMQEENAKLGAKERALQQRLLVNQRLGLDVAAAMGINTENIISNVDLSEENYENDPIVIKESVGDIVNSEMLSSGIVYSNRELNRAKRKAKIENKRKSGETSNYKKMRTKSQDEMEDDLLTIVEENVPEKQSWPLEEFSNRLCCNLFSSSWETRHGAATALREVVTLHGNCAAKSPSQTASQMKRSHERWLEDTAVRLVCVLALDRFGDFVSDQVVAPVRETCAQVLGVVIHHLNDDVVTTIMFLLLEMLSWPDWGTRHGGLLGLKYLLAIKENLRFKLLSNSFKYIYKGLQDNIDDVVAVAATCLVPVAADLVDCLEEEERIHLVSTLWDSLLEIDDLTASTNSILLLLAKLLTFPQLRNNCCTEFDVLLVRVFPFLFHNNSLVRASALKTIATLTNSPSQESTNGYWQEKILEPLLIHTFQRALLETDGESIQLVIKIWNNIIANVSISHLLLVTCRLVPSWFCLLMTNHKVPLDSNIIVIAQHNKIENVKRCFRANEPAVCDRKFYIGNTRGNLDDPKDAEKVSKARCVAAKLLGNLSHYVSQPMPDVKYEDNETPILCYVRLLLSHLNTRSGIQRFGVSLILREWAIHHPSTVCHPMLKSALINCVSEVIYYDEITWSFTRVQQETKDFVAMLKHYKVAVDESYSTTPVLALDKIKCLCDIVEAPVAKLRKKVSSTLELRRKEILRSLRQTSGEQIKLNVTIQAVLAGALVRFRALPDKLNPVIKPLIENIKKEENLEQQKMATSDLTFLMKHIMTRDPCPNGKIFKNISSFLCVDEDFTPNVLGEKSYSELYEGITSLAAQKTSIINFSRSTSFPGARGPGRPPASSIAPLTRAVSSSQTKEIGETKLANQIQRRGCTMALKSIVENFSSDLETQIPQLTALIFEPFETWVIVQNDVEISQNIINWMQLLETIIPSLHSSILQKFDKYLGIFDQWFTHPLNAVRHMAGRVLSTLARVSRESVMPHVLNIIVKGFSDLTSSARRRGAIECVHLLVETLGLNLVPYIVLLIVPVLGRMSDPEECIRLLSTQVFAQLVKLYPLDGVVRQESPGLLDDNLFRQKQKERAFLDRLLDPKKIENYDVKVLIQGELRPYQQRGVNWLSFLNEYNLHGILCDDMGLGKTLQSICILAADHQRKKNTKEIGLQSLVVCPSTLTSHWQYEFDRFVSRNYINPLNYTGPPMERRRLRNNFENHNVIIASYKIIRNEIEFFSNIHWNYIILDEGHIIKNGKTKSSKAIKRLVGNHRLILSGTPIQNNVIELWSLFDFLMPGFLGTEKQFMTKYSRPILQSRESKSSSKEQEAGVLAMETLHRQVLPFLLRRMKEDVLTDLPPKITQDYYCDLSPLQEKLYEDFSQSKVGLGIDESLDGEVPTKLHGHVFQALQYLRRVCNHPKLVLTANHPRYNDVTRDLTENKSSLSDICHSAKLAALKQLLADCGIGSYEDSSASFVVSPHRALIFCQLKGMLDIIEQDLFKVHMPNVTYLRLDGSVVTGLRHNLVQKFNSDPSIDVLLLTTHVGGLGLNLTGADTVIFVEHDWNPMRDLQAMDRAHRIGQKRVVNVYRLITKGTLEEKIMSYQKFKIMTANSVISHENSSLKSMGTDQLLDLFTFNAKEEKKNQTNETSLSNQCLGISGAKKVLDNLPQLWDQNAYENEYNFDQFISTLI